MVFLIRTIFLILLGCLQFLSYNGVEGGKSLSREEEKDIEKQLKLLNKQAVKTIKTEYGDIYDCVDLYKQPAFDHPLLKNHTLQMKPSSTPKQMRENKVSNVNVEAINIGLKSGGCPSGTVPLRRITKDNLIRIKLHSKQFGSKFGMLTHAKPGVHYAGVQVIVVTNVMYNGGSGIISIYQPSVKNSQYSSARMKIGNYPDYIQIGWTVNPILYNDTNTRLYTSWNEDTTGCYNQLCPGFVSVNPSIPIDSIFHEVSKRGGKLWALHVLIHKDQSTGNWWLAVGPNHDNVGYWPQTLFTKLSDLATSVEWGGEVFSPTNIPSPPMGSGFYPERDTSIDAFIAKMTTINDANKATAAPNTIEFHDGAYKAYDEGNVNFEYEHLMEFGGPGGTIGE